MYSNTVDNVVFTFFCNPCSFDFVVDIVDTVDTVELAIVLNVLVLAVVIDTVI